MADQNTQNVNLIVKGEEKHGDEVVISLSAIVKKLKKYFLVWFMTAVIIGGLIGGASIFFNTTSASPVMALVSFTHKNIEKGKNPDGSDFKPYDIKNPSVLERALKDCNMELEMLETVRRDIEVEGIIPEDAVNRITAYKNIYETATNGQLAAANAMLETTWYSTQYQLTFDYKDAKITRGQAVQLLNAILDRYRDYFFEQYGYNEALGNVLSSMDYTEYDYAEAVDMFRTSLNSLNRYVSSLATDDTTRFRSSVTGLTFADLKSNISAIKDLDLDLISSYLNLNNITKDKDRLQAYYEFRIENLERQLKTDEETLTAVNNAFDSYEKDQVIIFSDSVANTESTIASEEYDKLVNRKISAQNSVSETKQQIDYYKERLTTLRKTTVGSTDKVKKIEADLERVDQKVKDLVQTVNDTADDYYQHVSLANAYNILVPATSDVPTTVMTGIKKAIIPAVGLEALLFVGYLTYAFIEAIKEENLKRNPVAAEGETEAAGGDDPKTEEKTEDAPAETPAEESNDNSKKKKKK
ncbi:MAG: lipopolysaccharide biosynthesis protein [Oscillospiraceae bacterium]|nr:lipopolysaccharide biosynthesis protein [Oscillospiraceae bacterium]MCR4760793.1 lipopolysaccharide biosynthesis protein [Oscillospiraceae bacterium]